IEILDVTTVIDMLTVTTGAGIVMALKDVDLVTEITIENMKIETPITAVVDLGQGNMTKEIESATGRYKTPL
ncbi:hypothetical protein K7432_009046, partial [Basidiobolus ranarum]